METAIPGIVKKPFIKRKAFRIIVIFLVIALLAVGAYAYLRARHNGGNAVVQQRTATVVRGELTASITGSAPIESANRSELSPKVTATLQKINCKEGDQVKAGDVLFVLDNTDALLNIENTQNNIDQMQLTINNTAKSLEGLVVKAPFGGQVKNISVKEGDTINKGGTLMTITDTSRLTATLSFSGSEAGKIKAGQKATVYLQDMMQSVDGKVTYVSGKPHTTASGGELYSIDIEVANPGSLTEGMKVTADVEIDGAVLESVESGSLAYINSKVLRSDAGGTVTVMKLRENEYVNAGDVLVRLENDDLALTASTNEVKMKNLNEQLDIQKKQLDYYTIKAPFDGTITKMGTANEGDTVKQGEVLAVVSNMNALQFSVDIDELDISKVAVGQEVKITSDAIEGSAENPLTGKVTKIAMEGNTSNGVTTYPVTVTVDADSAAKLKTGMNIDAEIIIASKPDVLMVPLEAITKIGNRSFVYVKSASGQGSGAEAGQGNMNGGMWQGQFGQNDQNGQSGFSGNAQYFRRRNTSGSAIGSENWPQGGNTSGPAVGAGNWLQDGNVSGTAITGDWPQDGNTSGSAFRRGRMFGDPGQAGNTSGSAVAGFTGRAGGTSQSALQGSFARARRASADSYYAGTIPVEVQTGISNDSYIEIVSGLTEGEEIVLPKTSASSNSSTNRYNQGGGFGIGGGFMGGGNMVRRAPGD